MPDFELFDRVEGNYKGSGKWYSGIIVEVHPRAAAGESCYHVAYDDGDQEKHMAAADLRAVKRTRRNRAQRQVAAAPEEVAAAARKKKAEEKKELARGKAAAAAEETQVAATKLPSQRRRAVVADDEDDPEEVDEIENIDEDESPYKCTQEELQLIEPWVARLQGYVATYGEETAVLFGGREPQAFLAEFFTMEVDDLQEGVETMSRILDQPDVTEAGKAIVQVVVRGVAFSTCAYICLFLC